MGVDHKPQLQSAFDLRYLTEETRHDAPDWSKPAQILLPELRKRREAGEPVWLPSPISFAVADQKKPVNNAQDLVLQQLRDRLIHPEVQAEHLPSPSRLNTHAVQVPSMVFVFGDGDQNSPIKPRDVYTKMPTPKPRLFYVNTTRQLPEVNFQNAREMLANSSCHNGVLFESPDGQRITGAMWASMQGNHKEIRGTQDEIFDDILWRILTIYGSKDMTTPYETVAPVLTLNQYLKMQPTFKSMFNAAQALSQQGLIEDSVQLSNYTSHAHQIEETVGKRYGESMRASFVEDTLLVSVSGGGKVNFSINPLDGALVPVVGITKDGYIMAKIEDADITFPGSSVETWEAVAIGLAGQSTQDGVENFEQYIGWLNFQFSRHQVLPVVLPGHKILYSELDHNHNQTIAGTYDPSRLSVSRPDSRYFPPRDFSCGMFESAMDSVSGFWQADRKETVIIELPGHGLIALGNGRENLTRTLTQEVELKTPEWV